MGRQKFQIPRVRAIVLGILAFLLIIMLFCNLSEAIKVVGAPFLFLPDKLGMIRTASADEVSSVDLRSSPTVFNFVKAGRYVVYTIDYDLLVINDGLRDANAKPWIHIESQETEEEVQIDFIYRGLRPYDSALVKGRPVLTFEIETPGLYRMQHPSRQVIISILPDYITGNEGAIVFYTLVQIAMLAVPIGLIFSNLYARQQKKTKAIKDLKKIKGDSFWKDEMERRKKGR